MKEHGGATGAVIRGFFFQRLTARVFGADPDGWLLKGGQALLVRYPSRARLSKDIDLQHLGGDPNEALAALVKAATADLGDHLNFVPRQATHHGTDAEGVNQSFEVFIGVRKVDTIHVDLVTGRTVTAPPQTMQLEPRPGLPWPTDWPVIKLYPVVDHLADKVCAMYEWRSSNPSSRFRDLADILLISQNETIEAGEAHHALHAEAAVRRARDNGVELRLPAGFEMPHASWRAGYAKAAKDVAGLSGCGDWEAAHEAADRFVTPLLGPAFIGTWDPASPGWNSN
ncbi:nucleotidyl transferase AbiEii/AbiGii toxin family protein [Streptomyces sp. NBC_01242]|uniref:nucleotidyl transferase AbiEii/AbiGii toxin family protein n=1 Tax=Streptomyces sp. NBC_01242 TaxID=2903795 RepID=UPI0022556DDF|nr:nucleotidyl transferase AbiEii/AbiGii toxin family protein [Streptomyces sp. NBC_01242]MCX4799939.1 nucleotidyl transferase AbiEii/AbiGii toxin family protein [Streptomyces sp. NBC_01242]